MAFPPLPVYKRPDPQTKPQTNSRYKEHIEPHLPLRGSSSQKATNDNRETLSSLIIIISCFLARQSVSQTNNNNMPSTIDFSVSDAKLDALLLLREKNERMQPITVTKTTTSANPEPKKTQTASCAAAASAQSKKSANTAASSRTGPSDPPPHAQLLLLLLRIVLLRATASDRNHLPSSSQKTRAAFKIGARGTSPWTVVAGAETKRVRYLQNYLDKAFEEQRAQQQQQSQPPPPQQPKQQAPFLLRQPAFPAL